MASNTASHCHSILYLCYMPSIRYLYCTPLVLHFRSSQPQLSFHVEHQQPVLGSLGSVIQCKLKPALAFTPHLQLPAQRFFRHHSVESHQNYLALMILNPAVRQTLTKELTDKCSPLHPSHDEFHIASSWIKEPDCPTVYHCTDSTIFLFTPPDPYACIHHSNTNFSGFSKEIKVKIISHTKIQ